ncbi:MAG: diphthine--ammonia ligase [Candidatus Parvarchaeota archaeon]|nr:diphthine--ammonia ligase [Candidatus Rehaiarchaeum fermentans]
MRLATLFTGGKDSTYSTYIAKKCGHEVNLLIHLLSKNIDSYMFHAVGNEFARAEASALNIKIEEFETEGEKEKELEDLKNAIKIAKEKYGIEGIISGALMSNYQYTRIKKILDELGLYSFTPLWKTNLKNYLNELIEVGFKPIIISVSAEGLDESFLGKIIDKELLKNLEILSNKYGFNLGFEGGEAETAVLDGPIFEKRLIIENFEIEKDEGKYYIKNVKIRLENK